jgi:hypothetical protein
VIAQEMQPLEIAQARAAQVILVRTIESSLTEDGLAKLKKLLDDNRGQVPVEFDILTIDHLSIRLRAGQLLRVEVAPHLIDSIKAIDRDWEVELVLD